MNKNNKNSIFIYTFLIFINGICYSQESINSCGSDISGNGGNVAFSVSQLVYNTYNSNNGSSAQGVQHAYEIITLGDNSNPKNLRVKSFPNPTNENLIIEGGHEIEGELYYELLDLNGKIVKSGIIIEKHIIIDMSREASSNYLINVMDSRNTKIQSFKIIKN